MLAPGNCLSRIAPSTFKTTSFAPPSSRPACRRSLYDDSGAHAQRWMLDHRTTCRSERPRPVGRPVGWLDGVGQVASVSLHAFAGGGYQSSCGLHRETTRGCLRLVGPGPVNGDDCLRFPASRVWLSGFAYCRDKLLILVNLHSRHQGIDPREHVSQTSHRQSRRQPDNQSWKAGPMRISIFRRATLAVGPLKFRSCVCNKPVRQTRAVCWPRLPQLQVSIHRRELDTLTTSAVAFRCSCPCQCHLGRLQTIVVLFPRHARLGTCCTRGARVPRERSRAARSHGFRALRFFFLLFSFCC
jgi:hypothetical protein